MKNLSRILRFLKPYRLKALVSTVFLLCVVFLDLAIPRLVQQLIDFGITPGNLDVVRNTALLMLVVSFLNMIFAIIYNTLSVDVSESFARDLRDGIFKKIQELSYRNLDQLRTGNLIVRLTSDVTVLQNTIRMALRFGIRAPLIIGGSLVLMYSTDANLTFKIVPLMLLTLLIVWLFIDKLGPIFLQVQKKLDGLNTVLQENIAGVRVVKAFAQRQHEEERFENANQAFTNMHVKIMRFMSSFGPLLTLTINMAIVVVIWGGGIEVIAGSLSLGAIVAFTDYLMTIMAPLSFLVMMANAIAAGTASADRVYEVLDTIPDIRELPAAIHLSDKTAGGVVFNHVSFRYDGVESENVLENINFEAQPGQTIAILGATGSGKTTLVNLIPRFYDATSGSLSINGVDVRKMAEESLLSLIGIAPQDTILFSGSIMENIRYGYSQASDADVLLAARVSQAHDFISELPDGYQTSVAQRGVNLSGGQKQRIAIARAILRKPKILILDDSTSAVDVETEARIQAALFDFMQNSTVFLVAQRISTVLNTDKIIVLDSGRISAQGTHIELLKSSSIYKEIYDSQLGNGNHLVGELFGKSSVRGAQANG